MKQSVPPGVVIGLVAVLLLVLVVFAAKYFGIGEDPTKTNSTPAEIREMQEGKAKRMQTDIFGRPRTPNPGQQKFSAPAGQQTQTPH